MSHLTYVEAIVTGIVQGVTELFPISSLGHNVLIPALIGGSWAKDLSVTSKNSPYLAFIVGLHVATALAMIIYFRRDWIRIIRGFFTSVRSRRAETSDERLAWMIILGTIPVGLVGLVLQKVFTSVFAKPTLTAFFLAVNGVILLVSERQRRRRLAVDEGDYADYEDGYGYDAPAPAPEWRGRPAGGYSQQPQQQQWQGPVRPDPDDPRYGGDPRYGTDPRHGGDPRYGTDPRHGGDPRYGERPQPRFEPNPGYGQAPGRGQVPRRGQAPAAAGPTFTPNPGYRPPAYQPDPRYGAQDAAYGPAGDATYVMDPRGARHGRVPADADPAVEADHRLSLMRFGQAVLIGAAQILALLPGISRDGIVTVFGMWRGLSREDAVRFSFLLSAPVILAAGVLKAKDLFGPLGKGIHGPVLVGSILAFVGAYLSVRFLTRYFSESRSLNPFGIYCIVAGLLSLGYLTIH